MANTTPYRLKLSLNALNHLGINLYSNTAAVVAEAVANAWDADAEHVSITLDTKNKTITIKDDGHGMSLKDANDKFLTVGYARRDNDETVTPKHKRLVMGRKGIGKLSLFSIARTIEVHSVNGGKKHGFRMALDKIEEAIKNGDDSAYQPPQVSVAEITITKGTQIVLSNLKKGLQSVSTGLRKRLARRFSVFGPDYNFAVDIDGKPVTIEDRDYFHKVQYLWRYDDTDARILKLSKNQKHEVARSAVVSYSPPFSISGWIASAEKAGDLKDEGENLNKIPIMVRGKMAHEDIMEEFNEGGVYSKYLFGEIHADFLDLDEEADIATSSRQRIIEDDPRYVALRSFVKKELNFIQSEWTTLRNQEGTDDALLYPEIQAWFETLSGTNQEMAKRLFGKLNQLPLDDEPETRQALYKQSIIAFQSLSAKERLHELESIGPSDVKILARILGDLSDLDSARYYQITKERLQVIHTLRDKINQNALEKVVQSHLFEHLWLLDPSWERATDVPASLEQSVSKEFDKVYKSLSADERKGRLDIRYRTSAGKHIIVELKRPDRSCSTSELIEQIQKYRSALRKCLVASGQASPAIESICVIGKPLKDWATDESKQRQETKNMMASIDARVIQYQELIIQAERAYKAYLEKSTSDSALSKLIEGIDTGAVFGKAPAVTIKKATAAKANSKLGKPAVRKAVIKAKAKKKAVIKIKQK